MLRAEGVINLEEFNLLQMATNYTSQIKAVSSDAGRPVYASIYDLLLVYDDWDMDGDWVFRGQGDAAWGYEPSEARIDRPEAATENKRLRSIFLQQVRRAYPELGRDYWQMLALAQHYGFKTMLFDFSFSLQVAAYFAACAPPKEASLGCIMCISRTDFSSLGLGEFRIIEATTENVRVRRQNGCFITRFSPRLLGERGLFDAPCFVHTPAPEIYLGGRLLCQDYLFPPENRDPLRQMAQAVLRRGG
jgi:hypothetical protein